MAVVFCPLWAVYACAAAGDPADSGGAGCVGGGGDGVGEDGGGDCAAVGAVLAAAARAWPDYSLHLPHAGVGAGFV